MGTSKGIVAAVREAVLVGHRHGHAEYGQDQTARRDRAAPAIVSQFYPEAVESSYPLSKVVDPGVDPGVDRLERLRLQGTR
jgi:hypothetical protein